MLGFMADLCMRTTVPESLSPEPVKVRADANQWLIINATLMFEINM
jgi:hypothetical protein